MQKFTTEWNGMWIVGEYDWEISDLDIIYPKYDKDTEEFEALTVAELLCIKRQLYEQVDEYLDYVRESYREDIACERVLDQAVEIERASAGMW